MTAVTEALPGSEPRTRDLHIGRAMAAAILYPFFGIGWLLGRGLLMLGWFAGRIWLVLAFMAETVAFGFRQGAGLPAEPEVPEAVPDTPRPAKV